MGKSPTKEEGFNKSVVVWNVGIPDMRYRRFLFALRWMWALQGWSWKEKTTRSWVTERSFIWNSRRLQYSMHSPLCPKAEFQRNNDFTPACGTCSLSRDFENRLACSSILEKEWAKKKGKETLPWKPKAFIDLNWFFFICSSRARGSSLNVKHPKPVGSAKEISSSLI